MSPALPAITARELIRALELAGFVFRRQRGSHQIYQHQQTGKRVSVPVHTGDFPKGTLRQILRDADLSVERFLELLRRWSDSVVRGIETGGDNRIRTGE